MTKQQKKYKGILSILNIGGFGVLCVCLLILYGFAIHKHYIFMDLFFLFPI